MNIKHRPDQGQERGSQVNDGTVAEKWLCTDYIQTYNHHSASPVAFMNSWSLPFTFMMPSFKWNFHLFLLRFIYNIDLRSFNGQFAGKRCLGWYHVIPFWVLLQQGWWRWHWWQMNSEGPTQNVGDFALLKPSLNSADVPTKVGKTFTGAPEQLRPDALPAITSHLYGCQRVGVKPTSR